MYAKIFTQIFDSTLADDYEVRHVFEDLLKLCDQDGTVDMPPSAISARTRIPIDIINRAIGQLSSPDTQSRSPEHDGRRLINIDQRGWGWRIVNYGKYRDVRSELDRRRIVGSARYGGYVYFLSTTNESDGIKIGHSNNPWSRAKEMSTAHPNGCVLIGQFAGGLEVESDWHKRFNDIRLNGEWFKSTPELLAAINSVVDTSLRKVATKRPRSNYAPKQKHKEKEIEKNKTLEIDLPFKSVEFMETWDKWENFRREIKKTNTPTTRALQLAKLGKMGEAGAVASLEHSMTNGWVGIFDPPAGKNTAPARRESKI